MRSFFLLLMAVAAAIHAAALGTPRSAIVARDQPTCISDNDLTASAVKCYSSANAPSAAAIASKLRGSAKDAQDQNYAGDIQSYCHNQIGTQQGVFYLDSDGSYTEISALTQDCQLSESSCVDALNFINQTCHLGNPHRSDEWVGGEIKTALVDLSIYRIGKDSFGDIDSILAWKRGVPAAGDSNLAWERKVPHTSDPGLAWKRGVPDNTDPGTAWKRDVPDNSDSNLAWKRDVPDSGNPSTAWKRQDSTDPNSAWKRQDSTDPDSAWKRDVPDNSDPSTAWKRQDSTDPDSAWKRQDSTDPNTAWKRALTSRDVPDSGNPSTAWKRESDDNGQPWKHNASG